MITGASHFERIGAFESEHDAVLIVHPHRVPTPEVTRERVQPISGRYLQVVEPSYRVDLVQFPSHGGPEHARDAPSRLAIDAVPDIARCVIGQRPNHQLAL